MNLEADPKNGISCVTKTISGALIQSLRYIQTSRPKKSRYFIFSIGLRTDTDTDIEYRTKIGIGTGTDNEYRIKNGIDTGTDTEYRTKIGIGTSTDLNI